MAKGIVQQEERSMRYFPTLKEEIVKLFVDLHYRGLLMLLIVMLRLALEIRLMEKGEKIRELFALKVIEGVLGVFEPVIV